MHDKLDEVFDKTGKAKKIVVVQPSTDLQWFSHNLLWKLLAFHQRLDKKKNEISRGTSRFSNSTKYDL